MGHRGRRTWGSPACGSAEVDCHRPRSGGRRNGHENPLVRQGPEPTAAATVVVAPAEIVASDMTPMAVAGVADVVETRRGSASSVLQALDGDMGGTLLRIDLGYLAAERLQAAHHVVKALAPNVVVGTGHCRGGS